MFLHIYQKRFCNIYRNCYIVLPNVMRKSLLMFNDSVSLIFNRISVFYFGFFFFFSLSCNLENQFPSLPSEHS